MGKTYILHLYHPDGPCTRLLFHSRVAAMKRAKAWVAEHFADRQEQFMHDIMAETDYFNPVYLAELGAAIAENAHFIVRLGGETVHYPTTAEAAWRLVDSYAINQKFPTNYLTKLHAFLLQYGYEQKLNILFYPIEWGD